MTPPSNPTPRRARRAARPRRLPASLAVLVAVLGVASCGDDSASAPPDLSGPALAGYQLARDSGCFACHGDSGRGNGPAVGWVGLAGSTVQLQDGTSVVADTQHLLTAILDPQREIRAGSTLLMPVNTLTEAQAAEIVAYIETLR